jgi:hypothetical protein
MRSAAIQRVGTLLLSVCGESEPSDAELGEFVDAVNASDLTRLRCLFVTGGGGPSTVQRSRLKDVLQGRTLPTAIVLESDAPRLRYVATALSWFNRGVKTFAADELHRALRYLEVPVAQFGEVDAELEALRRQVLPAGFAARRPRR